MHQCLLHTHTPHHRRAMLNPRSVLRALQERYGAADVDVELAYMEVCWKLVPFF